jgi:antirestriction protein ArdC
LSCTPTRSSASRRIASEHAIPFIKGYTVFNVEQIEGLPERFYAKAEPRGETVQRIAHAENYIAATGPEVRHGGNRAFYSPASDYVQMPPIEAFRDAEAYYATLLHETTHYTHHPSRLARDLGRKRWGMKVTRRRNWSPNWDRPSCAPTSD